MTEVHTDAPAAPPSRARMRWWHVAVLILGVVVLAGAVAFAVHASSDRDEAVASQRRRADALADAKDATESMRTTLADLRTQGGNVRRQMEEFLGSADRMMALSDQQVAESTTTQRLGADLSVVLEDINASITRNNGLLEQYDAERELFAKLGFGLFGFGDDQAESVNVPQARGDGQAVVTVSNR